MPALSWLTLLDVLKGCPHHGGSGVWVLVFLIRVSPLYSWTVTLLLWGREGMRLGRRRVGNGGKGLGNIPATDAIGRTL